MSDESGDNLGFRQLRRVGVELDGLDLYSRVTQGRGGSISDLERIDGALDDLRGALINVTGRASTLHGWQAQALFEAVVVSLGRVQLLKAEDSGDAYFSGPDLKVPDFRLVTEEGDQALVEVKSFFQKSDPREAYKVRRKDLQAWQRYADLVGAPLHLAVYWVKWNTWTLVDPDRFDRNNGPVLVSFPEAMKANEMIRVGDRFVGTEYPIGLTFFSDPNQPRTIEAGGGFPFTVGRAEYSVRRASRHKPERAEPHPPAHAPRRMVRGIEHPGGRRRGCLHFLHVFAGGRANARAAFRNAQTAQLDPVVNVPTGDPRS